MCAGSVDGAKVNKSAVVDDGDRKLGHELANILTPVVGMSDLLVHRAEEHRDPEIARLAETLRDSAKLARNLVERHRQIHALENGSREYTWQKGNLVDLMKSIVNGVANAPFAEGVVIYSFCEVDHAQVEMDYDLLPAVFGNIIKNAVEHVASEPDLDERIVHVRLTATCGGYTVRISNPGSPIPAEKIDSFFGKFNSDRSRKPHGAGLGTTYARLVTRAHGGQISVESDAERGTAVTISILGVRKSSAPGPV